MLQGRVLGRDSELIALHSADDHRLVTEHMLGQARREFCLLTRNMDQAIYDQEGFIAGLKALALRSRTSHIRILLQDNDKAIKQGHRIIGLARRLTSSLEIHTPAADWLEHAENFLLIDDCGFIHQTLATSHEATASYQAPLKVQRLRAEFEHIWDSSEGDSELRRLYL